MPACSHCLFLNLSLFTAMEAGQSQALTRSQAQAFLGVPTSALSERVQAVQCIICYAMIPGAWFRFASRRQEYITPPFPSLPLPPHPPAPFIPTALCLLPKPCTVHQEHPSLQPSGRISCSVWARGGGVPGSQLVRGIFWVLPLLSSK